ncbi:hypothetical protein RQP46_009143 [Phenoliferia psychrophenolica]
MTSMTNEQAFAELYYSKKAIKDVLGITMITIVWEEDTSDWDWATIGISGVKENYEHILEKQADGSYETFGPVVLSHEIDGTTMEISQELLPQLQQQFAAVVPTDPDFDQLAGLRIG